MSSDEIALQLAVEMLRKSGVRDWDDETLRINIANAAVEMAQILATLGGCMANKILYAEQNGTPKQIVFCDSANDFSPTTANDLRLSDSGSRTNVALQMASVANAAARQSAKVDLGDKRATAYAVRAAFELAATPTAGNIIRLYWASSQSSTAANGNPGAVSGSNAAYTGYSSNLEASLLQLQFIGAFTCTAQATGTIQVADVGQFSPGERYGSLVVVNSSGAAMHSDDVEIHVVFDPLVVEVQNAA